MVAAKGKKSGLGRGLDALFAEVDVNPESVQGKGKSGKNASGNGITYIQIDDIKPNTAQPRNIFSKESLEGLAKSIEKHGLIQPVMVKKSGQGYELIAGERRWKAARKAGLKEIPAMIRDVSPEENSLLALIENTQREDLNPIDEAAAYRKIMDEHRLTQEELSKSVGKSRSYIANMLRLLKLPEKIIGYISAGKMSPGHGNAIGAIQSEKTMLTIAEKIVSEGLSVREAEALAQQTGRAGAKPRKTVSRATKNPEIKAIEDELTSIFGTRVTIGKSTTKGAVEIHYYSRDELDGLIEELMTFKH